MAAKPYARLDLNAAELDDVRGSVGESRKRVFASWCAAPAGPEKEFYAKRVAAYDALLARFDAVLIADTSQDADDDEDEED